MRGSVYADEGYVTSLYYYMSRILGWIDSLDLSTGLREISRGEGSSMLSPLHRSSPGHSQWRGPDTKSLALLVLSGTPLEVFSPQQPLHMGQSEGSSQISRPMGNQYSHLHAAPASAFLHVQ